MNFYIDCEFNGYQGELLSMALVAENGREWYAELHPPTCIELWVRQHVMPLLDGEPLYIKQMQASLYAFLTSFPGEHIHIVADWPDDIKYFCHVLLTGPGTSISPPSFTMEVRRHLSSDASEKPHHALHDARAIRRAAERASIVDIPV